MASTSVEVTLPFNSAPRLDRVTAAVLRRREYTHEMLIIDCYNQNATSLDLRTGDPISAVLKGSAQAPDTFVGYVHEVRSKVSKNDPRTFRIICVGPTWVMKDEKQRIWPTTTISDLAHTILRENNLTADIEISNVMVPQLNQSGESDWAFLCRVAKAFGYVCYATGVVVHFHSRRRDLDQQRRGAVLLEYAQESFGKRSAIHKFEPQISDTLEAGKVRRTIRNVDPRTASQWAYTHDGTPAVPTRLESRAAIFNEFVTDQVSDTPQEVQVRLQGMQDNSMWNHRATAVLDGYTGTAPTSVFYLKGLKGNFDGYWTILHADHIYSNRDNYRMECRIGTNDLGAPIDSAIPGTLISIETDRVPTVPVGVQLVVPGGLSVPELLAARGGPEGMRWRGQVSSVNPPAPSPAIPWFVRRKHKYVGA